MTHSTLLIESKPMRAVTEENHEGTEIHAMFITPTVREAYMQDIISGVSSFQRIRNLLEIIANIVDATFFYQIRCISHSRVL